MINEEDKFAGLPEHLQSCGSAQQPKETVIARGKVELLMEEENNGDILCIGSVLKGENETIELSDILNQAEAESLDGKTIEIIIREVDND